MTPYDPTGAGRTLDAPDMRIDGQAVAADGTFPGLAADPASSRTTDGCRSRSPPGKRSSSRCTTTPRPTRDRRCERCRAGDPVAVARGAGVVRRRSCRASIAPMRPATTATVVSTAGDATLSVSDPSATATGRLANGAFTLAEPLQVRANVRFLRAVGHDAARRCSPDVRAPVSNDAVAIAFRQHIGATDPLRTGDLLQDPDVHAVDHDAVANRPTSGRRWGSSKA